MAQTNLTIRIDDGIKHEAELLFNKIGLNMSSAINIFIRQALREQSIPFELRPYDDGCTPNADTIAFIKRVENGEEEMFGPFDTYEAFKASLEEDDDDEI